MRVVNDIWKILFVDVMWNKQTQLNYVHLEDFSTYYVEKTIRTTYKNTTCEL